MYAHLQENVQRKLREEREEKRRKQKEEDDKRKKAKQDASKAAQKSKQTARGFVDRLLSGIRGGSKLRQQASAAKDVESTKGKTWNQLKKGLIGGLSSSPRPPSDARESDDTVVVLKDHTQADSKQPNDQVRVCTA